MGKKVKEYKSGDFIFAKVKGYPAWPARIQRPNGKKYLVYFYGTGETANLPPNQIFDYAENKDKFLTKTVKRKDFNDGVLQIDHDFTNNVPLEDVIGVAVAEPMDTTANDTGVESANSTANDSALNDTADTTADPNASVNETNTAADASAAVEDSDDGALVIDEGKKAKKPAAKATPKAAAKEPKTPRGKAKKEDKPEAEKPAEEEKKDEELVSRSGRKIRPKRFVDEQTEENATLPSPAAKKRRGSPAPADKDKPAKPDAEPAKTQYQALTQSELEDIKEPIMNADAEKDHILIAALPNNQYVGIKLFQSKPTFKNDAAKLQWFKQASANALTLKSQLEKGHITVASVSAQIETDLNLTDEEKANLDKEREIEEKKSRVQFLKTEMKLIELDAKIKSCLSLDKADPELCLKLIDELMELEIKPLMLLKHPTCVETLRRVRAYVGNTPVWELSPGGAAAFTRRAQQIRRQAETAYRKLKELYTVPEGLSFWEFFSERVQLFNKATAKLNADELLEMVHEPIELSQPSAHTMRAAIDAANSVKDTDIKEKDNKEKDNKVKDNKDKDNKEKDNKEKDNEEKDAEKTPATPKKRGAPAKNKKAAATPKPAATPKRNSARNKKEPQPESEEKQDSEKPEENTEKDKDTTEKETTEKETTDKETTDKETIDKDVESQETNNTEKAQENDKPTENGDVEMNDKATNENNKDSAIENEKASTEEVENSKEVDKSSKEVETSTENSGEEAKEVENQKETENSKESEKEVEKSSKEVEQSSIEVEKSSKEIEKLSKEVEKSSKEIEKLSKEVEKKEVAEGEPRAKRSRESTKKEAPPPKSPLKRKAKS